MNALASQLQSAFAMLGGAGSMFSPGAAGVDSGVNWEVTKDTARKTAASLGPDPSPDGGQQRALAEAVSLAELWLDEATTFPRVSATVAAWSRAEWIEQTLPVWRRLVEPVAGHIADAMEGALNVGGSEAAAIPGLAGMEQMLRPMLRSSGASMFGLQLGQGLGQLSTEVVGATDIGLPLSEPGHVALLPTNVAAFGAGLEQSIGDVTLYLALRECARQRLFAAAGWLREQMLALVGEYARGITIDTSALEDAVGRIDPSNLSELSSTLEGNLFAPQQTPEQKAVLQRLETMLALVEGWVDEVVAQATAAADAVRRRAGRDRTPGPGDRRAGRGHLRHAGGAGAATTPDAGRRQSVGRRPRRPGHRGPGRRLVPPRPRPDVGRPGRPAGLRLRGAGRAGRGRRLRRRPGRAAGRRAGRGRGPGYVLTSSRRTGGPWS